MIPKLIDSVCNVVISGDEIIIITMISRYFQVWNNINEKFVKKFFISKKWLYRLPKGFVICDVTRINITKEVITFHS